VKKQGNTTHGHKMSLYADKFLWSIKLRPSFVTTKLIFSRVKSKTCSENQSCQEQKFWKPVLSQVFNDISLQVINICIRTQLNIYTRIMENYRPSTLSYHKCKIVKPGPRVITIQLSTYINGRRTSQVMQKKTCKSKISQIFKNTKNRQIFYNTINIQWR